MRLAIIKQLLHEGREIWQHVTWRNLLIAEALGMYIDVLRYLSILAEPPRPGHWLIAKTLYAIITPLLVLFALVAAERAVDRGRPAGRTYALALAVAAALAGIMYCYLAVQFHAYLASRLAIPEPTRSLENFLETLLDTVIIGGAVMLATYNRRSATRALEAVRTADLQRVRLERRLIESNVDMAQAELDPSALLASLAQIRSLLISGSAAADAALEALIQSLRERSSGLGSQSGVVSEAARAPIPTWTGER